MKVGILGAMSIEVDGLCNKLERKIVKSIAGNEYNAGQLNGVSVVVVKCGVGKVNAAVATQVMIDHFDIDCIINTGVAGSLNNSLNILDLVISDDLVQHDFDTTGAGQEQFGLIPGFQNVAFDVNKKLSQLAVDTGQEIFGKDSVYLGRIATGDQFICDSTRKERIVKLFGAICVEMEGSAIAQTCYLNNMPFLVIRAIFNKSDESATMNSADFEVKAADVSSKLVEALVFKLQKFEL